MKYDTFHKPVLIKEVLYYLNPKKGDVIFEGTLGGAGHTIEIIKAIAPTGKLIGADIDSKALSTATRKLNEYKRFLIPVNEDFSEVDKILINNNIEAVNGFFLDLGLSSMMIEDSGKGFSYLKKEKLDMRFDTRNPLTAEEVLNNYPEESLKEIFSKYGEEKFSGRIARKIIEKRKKQKIGYTTQLVEIINSSIPVSERTGKKRWASVKRVFQAIRIEVNEELSKLGIALDKGFEYLTPGGRMVVISYHSLEDRVVKKRFDFFSGKCKCPPGLPCCVCGAKKRADIITKKIIRPSDEEISENSRSRSAKLRALIKI
jgi:16S rRNA (cytosine1402-N4)-methyltransferase